MRQQVRTAVGADIAGRIGTSTRDPQDTLPCTASHALSRCSGRGTALARARARVSRTSWAVARARDKRCNTARTGLRVRYVAPQDKEPPVHKCTVAQRVSHSSGDARAALHCRALPGPVRARATRRHRRQKDPSRRRTSPGA